MFANDRQCKQICLGATLIELMIALTLGTLISIVLLQIYVSSQESYQLQTALLTIANHAKTAASILQSDVKAAGYIGCARLTADFPLVTHTNEMFSLKNKIITDDNNLFVRHANLVPAALIAPMRDHRIIYVNKNTHFNKGDTLMISDCRQAEIFSAKTVTTSNDQQIIVSTIPLRALYGEDAELSRLEVNHYFIAKTKRKNIQGKPLYALYVANIKQRKTELIENVNNMHITYLILEKGKLKEVSVNLVSDITKVQAIKIVMEFVAEPLKKIWYFYVAV